MAFCFMPLLLGLFGDVECVGQYVEQHSAHYFPDKQVQSTGPPFTTETRAINIHQNYWFYFPVMRDFFLSCDVPNNADYHNISNNTNIPDATEQSAS
jgi:hypothetical protein